VDDSSLITTPVSGSLHITTRHRSWLLVILTLAFTVRAIDLDFNTAFEGESFMILMGRSVLAGASDLGEYMRTAYGWYLWPAATALAEQAGGLTAVRLLAATLGTCAVGAIFLLARRLFDERVGLVAALFYAAFAPAILSSRVATPDAAGMALLAFSLAAYARAWQTGEWKAWIGAAVLAVGCVLVTHSLAVVVLLLCLLAPLLHRRRGSAFALTVAAPLALYAFWYMGVWREMLTTIANAASTRTPDSLIGLYVRHSLDVWLIAILAVVAFVRADRNTRRCIGVLCAGAVILAVIPVSPTFNSRALSQTIYPVILLLPAAAAGASGLADRLMSGDRVLASAMVVLAALSLFIVGGQGSTIRGGLPVDWPNAAVVSGFLQERVQYGQRVLVDDASLRLPLSQVTPTSRVVDQHGMQYAGLLAPTSFARAVADGYFDYVVLDGNVSDEAFAMHAAIQPAVMSRYVERLRTLQPNTGVDAVIYERVEPPVTRALDAPTIIVSTPKSGDTVITGGGTPSTVVTGHVERAPRDAVLRFDVYTDDWYVQGSPIAPSGARGLFSRRVVLGGGGADRCAHTIRVRLLSDDERILHEVIISRVVRTSADSVAIPCPAPQAK